MKRGSTISTALSVTLLGAALPPLQVSAGAMTGCSDNWRFNGEYRATNIRYVPQKYLDCNIARQVAGKVGRMSEPEVRRGQPIVTKPGGAMFSCRMPRKTYKTVYFDGYPYTSIKVRCRWWEWGGSPVIRFTKHSKIWD